MDCSILELVFFLIIENNAMIVNKVKYAGFPKRTREELNDKIILPFLSRDRFTSYISCSADGFFFFGYYYSFFRPKSQSNMII